MLFAPTTASFLARRAIQLRCLSSFSSLTQTPICIDSNNLTLIARKSNKIGGVDAPLPTFLMSDIHSLPHFALPAQNLQVHDDRQLVLSNQLNDHTWSDNQSELDAVIQASNRNSRRAKKANKGSRPCSRAGRRKRKEKLGNRGR